jgi:tripartite-type tricarboxylate transporter receptor subunit TctC
VFDKARMPYKQKITAGMSWNDIPPCPQAGLNVDYLMLRGIFMPAGVTDEQKAFYVDLLRKVRDTPEWKDFMEKGAFNTTALQGEDYVKWVAREEDRHRQLMREAGFLAGGR